MGILLYSNGITEDYVPQNMVFAERELVNLFNEYDRIKTKRLVTILNTWCIWGENADFDMMDLNRIVSDIVQEPVYSHALFVHDSEINPSWNATDNILYTNYSQYLKEMKKFIDTVANNIVEEFKYYEEEAGLKTMPVFENIGTTIDKRVLFAFNPESQYKDFYDNPEFTSFSKKAYEYLRSNAQTKEPFTIYADKKAIIVVDSHHVKSFLDKMVEQFQKEEQYEICKEITTMKKNWLKSIRKPRSKKLNNSTSDGKEE